MMNWHFCSSYFSQPEPSAIAGRRPCKGGGVSVSGPFCMEGLEYPYLNHP